MIAHSSLDAESVSILRDYANELLLYVSTFHSRASSPFFLLAVKLMSCPLGIW